MVNHVRTLLANLPPGDGPLDEYVPPEFDPRTVLHPYERQVRAVVFGRQPDRDRVQWRCRQLLAVTHASPLAGWLTADDPRITYDPYASAPPLPSASRLTGTGTLLVRRFRDPDPDAAVRIDVTVRVQPSGRLEATDLSGRTDVAETDWLPLAGSGWSVYATDPLPGQSWRVAGWVPPLPDLGVVVAAVDALPADLREWLFPDRVEEPDRTLRRAWFAYDDTPVRLAALTLALARRAAEPAEG